MAKKLGIVLSNKKTLGETARNYPMSIFILLFVLFVSFPLFLTSKVCCVRLCTLRLPYLHYLFGTDYSRKT